MNSKFSLFGLIRSRIFAGLLLVVPIAVSLWLAGFLYFRLTEWSVNVSEYFIPEPSDWWIHCVRLASLVFIIALLVFVGQLARYKVFRFFIDLAEWILLKVPMLNTIYSTCRQIGNAIWAPQGGMFSKVVLFEYPRKDIWVIGFLTNENKHSWELSEKSGEDLISIFLPTTPNPTSGFLLFIPRQDCKMLDMSVSEGMRLVISGGAVSSSHGESQEIQNESIPADPEQKLN